MEHYYVMIGNEYGMDLQSKQNFTSMEEAKKCFESVKGDDFGCVLMYVDKYGIEKMVDSYYDGE